MALQQAAMLLYSKADMYHIVDVCYQALEQQTQSNISIHFLSFHPSGTQHTCLTNICCFETSFCHFQTLHILYLTS